MYIMRRSIFFFLGCLFCLAAITAHGQSNMEPTYADVFYQSGNLRIQAYLYKPDGNGPFPVVIYNHGTRDGRERESVPFKYIGRMLTKAGYTVLVPERRGYGKSDGPKWQQEAGNDPLRLVYRLQSETDDVLAAVDYLRTLPYIDTKRIGIMGWSFGGIVTMMAVSRSTAFAVAVDQAGGALSWDRNEELRDALVYAAGKTTTPTLFLVAKNDRTTASITTLAESFKYRGIPHRIILYEPFTPAAGSGTAAPGHAVFSAQGMTVWKSDVLEFLGRYLKAEPVKKNDSAAPESRQ